MGVGVEVVRERVGGKEIFLPFVPSTENMPGPEASLKPQKQQCALKAL